MAQGPLAEYEAKLAAGELQPDPAQARAVDSLQALWSELDGYRPAVSAGWWKKRFSARDKNPPRGLYLFGDVGRGKSMAMDMFFRDAPPGPQTAGSFPRLHATGARGAGRDPVARRKRRRSHPGGGSPPCRRGAAPLFRRVSGPGHRRRDDPRPTVRLPVAAGGGYGHHSQPSARGLIRHSPYTIQIRGNRTTFPPPRELYPLCSHPMA